MSKKLLKGAAILFGVVVAYLFLAHQYGTFEERYECRGVRTYPDGKERPQRIYLKLTRHRWFLFWAGNDRMRADVPYEFPSYYPRITESDDNVYVFDDKGEQEGQLSTLNHTLSLKTSGGSVFKGTCARILQ
jgi:hypothetical protein